MNISKRSFIFGSMATTVLVALWEIDVTKAAVKIGNSPDDKKLLVKMIREVYPHDRFPDGPYERTADDVINKGNTDDKKVMFSKGIEDLKKAKYVNLNFEKATKHLKKIEKTDFFQHVRGTSTVTLYNDKEVWKLLGYEGYSFDKGGYINRGFNDLDWLPNPRIEEHPDLAAFLSESPKRFAEIKKMIANELN
tara:strand:+ start:4039 stop:4617 length:579 start_codon:yes stop_codon:yes gene_type:complete